MPLNSVNTNSSAMVALQALNRTADMLATTQKRISTTSRVADAKDDGAAFAVAQSIRADVAGLTAANEQMGNAQGIIGTALSGLGKVSDAMANIKTTLVRLSDDTLSTDQRALYEAQYTEQRTQITNYISDATYNGQSLLDTSTATRSTSRNETGTTYTVTAVDGAGTLVVAAAPTTSAAAQTALGAGGDFDTVMNLINTAMNTFGSNNKYIANQISYNSDKMDSLKDGMGALIDADLAKESANLQALQIRQQLGTQALSIANQAPQALLSLFR